MKHIIKIAFFSTLIMSLGCSKFGDNILDEQPPHIITAVTLYKSYDGFNAGVNGLYSLIRDTKKGENDYMGANLVNGTDNIATNYVYLGFEHIAETWGNINNPTHGQYIRQFTLLYRIINTANTIITRAEDEDVNWVGGSRGAEENKNYVVAEARAIRAWAYRHLTYGWGDVPLNIEESAGSNIKTDWERAPAGEVKQMIIDDLEFAEQHIPVEPEYSSRLTKGAVQTYLAEMYLAVNNPERALFWADQAISSPAYRLVTARYGVRQNEPGVPFMDMFKAGNENRADGNSEALWVWQFGINVVGGSSHSSIFFHVGRYWNIQVDGITPLQLTAERGGRGVARMSFTKFALDLYEPSDDRGSDHAIRKYFVLKSASENAPYAADRLPAGYSYGDTIHLDWSGDLTPTTKFDPKWPFSRKFDDGHNPNNLADGASYNSLPILRLAETYLLKAEAQLLLGDLPGAAETINVVRRRSNASDIDASQVTLDFILDERSRELILEEDRRWTLLRTQKWLERTRLHNKNGGQLITERDLLFPIPQGVIDANLTKEMPQNPGYN